MHSKFGRAVWILVLPFFAYLTLYTWNLRTGYLDRFSERTGLELVGWVLAPGEWVQERATFLWNRYMHLVDVSRENEQLQEQIDTLQLEIMRFREEAAQARRLRNLLSMPPPMGWSYSGARVVGKRLGPNASLQTVLLNAGISNGLGDNTPAITEAGVVGRIYRASANFSMVLLLTDPNSRIAVMSDSHRTPGILTGGGYRKSMQVQYIPLNAPLKEGEYLLTSGLAGIFPKGIPVARITKIVRSSLSLFQQVWADPVVDLEHLEEILLLYPHDTVWQKQKNQFAQGE